MNSELKPKIRFKGFADDWEQRKLKDIGDILTGSTPSTQHEEYYSQNGMLWVTPTDIDSNIIKNTAKKLSDEGVKVARIVPANTILVTCIASIGKNALTLEKSSFNQQINSLTPYKEYNPYFILTESSIWSKKMKQQGASGMMQMINKNEFSELETFAPNKQEQDKIGELFTNLDNLITLHQRKCNKLIELKKSLLEKTFPHNNSVIPEIRFKGFIDDWEQRKLENIFNYERPDNYIVSSTEYLEFGPTPVLTANKAFILGYTTEKNKYVNSKESIIFDDFTLETKFVDFPYMVKSSAIKILTLKDVIKDNIRFNFELLSNHKFNMLGHARHYISVVQPEEVFTPNKQEQDKIGELFTNLDNLINLHQRKHDKLNKIKQSLLNDMFV